MKNPRPNNALVLFCGCRGKYRDESIAFDIPEGSVVFVPEGSSYDWTFYDTESERVSTILFEFALIDRNGRRLGAELTTQIIEADAKGAKALFDKLIYEFHRPLSAPVRTKAAAYELLTFLLESGRKTATIRNLKCIYNGIKYLENDPRQDMSIAEIAKSCNVSVNYFERLFKEYAGCSPSEYRIKKKMERAILLISVGDMTVGQVAAELGFEDTAYFCRIFKKAFGITPTKAKYNTALVKQK